MFQTNDFKIIYYRRSGRQRITIVVLKVEDSFRGPHPWHQM